MLARLVDKAVRPLLTFSGQQPGAQQQQALICTPSLNSSGLLLQAAALRAQVKDRQRRGEWKTDTQGNLADKAARQLLSHINNLERPIKADEQEQASLIANERAFRETAMRAYRRRVPPLPQT